MRIVIASSFIYLMLLPDAGFAAEPSRPNFLIIYADDLGFGETGVQGCKDIPTPHIDSIAPPNHVLAFW